MMIGCGGRRVSMCAFFFFLALLHTFQSSTQRASPTVPVEGRAIFSPASHSRRPNLLLSFPTHSHSPFHFFQSLSSTSMHTSHCVCVTSVSPPIHTIHNHPSLSHSSHHLRFFSRSASALAASLKSMAP